MDSERDIGQYLKILILRTLGLNRDSVTRAVKCANPQMTEAEKWFRDCPQERAEDLVADRRIRRLVSRDFPGMEIDPAILTKASQIVGDDILLRYGKIARLEDTGSSGSESPFSPWDTTMRVSRRGEGGVIDSHQKSLLNVAADLHAQLVLPRLEQLFSTEICGIVHRETKQGRSSLSSMGWEFTIGGQVSLKRRPNSSRNEVVVRFAVEDDFMFPYVMAHLNAEFKGFRRLLQSWKDDFGQLVANSIEQISRVTKECREAAGMKYLDVRVKQGLFPAAPAYMCMFALEHINVPDRAEFNLVAEGDLWRLIPNDMPGWSMAIADKETTQKFQKSLTRLIRENTVLSVWPPIKSQHTKRQAETDEMRNLIHSVVERGTFEGVCPLCKESISQSSHTT